MNLLNTYLYRFSNYIFNKVNNTPILNICNYYYNNKITKKINNFELNKLKFYLFDRISLKNFKKIKDNIYVINKIFEGSRSLINNDINDYNIGVSYNIKLNKKYLYYNFNYNKIYKSLFNDTISFCSLGSISFPLTFVDFSNYNDYIYSIYKYISIKSYNSYKSCLISLFYYYSGLLFSLICLYGYDDIKVLDSNISIIVAKLSSFVLVLNSYYSNIVSNFIVSIKFINIINNSLYLCNINICDYKPYLIGLIRYTLINSGIFSRLSFQETLKTLKTLVLDSKIDWKVDSKSNIILSNFVPSGSGWYRYFTN